MAKHRNGPTKMITVAFQGHYSRFTDMQFLAQAIHDDARGVLARGQRQTLAAARHPPASAATDPAGLLPPSVALAQVLSAAELSLALRIEGATRTTIQHALWEDHKLIKTHEALCTCFPPRISRCGRRRCRPSRRSLLPDGGGAGTG